MSPSSNRLVKEKSPYLLQHAYNPVDWYPWGQEAFDKAKREDKPILLSIGYSTCHWCHVMAHESFEDHDIAKIMNEEFISIKVDREERPDIDQIYMAAVQAITGQGGWPLTVFLTPEQQPFFGGTYFPPVARWGSPGFIDVLHSIAHTWTNNREGVLQSGNNLTEFLRESAAQKRGEQTLTEDTLQRACVQIVNNFDEKNGGIGHAPKFPMGHNFSFLLRYWKRTGDKKCLEMVEQSLRAMAQGGLYDQIGGGFHRYSTDEYWHVPHFEKMLYDQALLARVFTETYQITQNEFYATNAHATLDYVVRDMSHAEGGFFSAEDADSQEKAGDSYKKEGAYYVWSEAQWHELLGDDAVMMAFYFGVEKSGNARMDPHGEFIGKNILYVAQTIDELAKKFNLSPESAAEKVRQSKEKLFKERARRIRPHLDDKILVDWNGLMISSFAYAGAVFNEPRYKQAAKNSADFILRRMVNSDGRLLHRFRDNEAGILGGLEDYAFFIQGLLDLYESVFEIKYLESAIKLSHEMVHLFEDQSSGGFFLTGADAEALIVRPKEMYDGAIPSGNSVAAFNLARLARMTGNPMWQNKADRILGSFSAVLFERPSVFCYAMSALDFILGPSIEIVVSSLRCDEAFMDFIASIHRYFLPRKVLLVRMGAEESSDVKTLMAIAPYTQSQHPIPQKISAFICQNHTCQLPITDLKVLEAALRR